MIAVLGATGRQGGAVLRALVDAGRPVRAVVRDPESPSAVALAESGIPLAVADLADVDSLTRAFEAASSVFAVTTPFENGTQAEEEQGEAIIEAADRAAISHLVLSSVASAQRGTGIPHFQSKAHIEHVLAATDLPATVVAPTAFYDNVLNSLDQIADGRMPLALPPDKPLQQVSRQDLGQVVAAVTAEPTRWIGQRIEIAGDEPSPSAMAAAISRAGHGVVRHHQVELEELRDNPDMYAMFRFLSEQGYSVNIPRLRDLFPEITWTSFAEWAMSRQWPVPRP